MKICARNRHFLRLGLVAMASLAWLVIRTGRKPSRIAYPCQKAAVANVQLFLFVFFLPLIDIRKTVQKLRQFFTLRLAKTILMLSLVLVTLGWAAVTFDNSLADERFVVPADLKPQDALSSVNSSDLFFVPNASGVDGNMDEAVSRLFPLMESQGLFFFNTSSQPSGLIASDDVVIVKVNCQWPERGGTNTDLIKSLIKEILNHPEGFTGEIVVADNGQGRGSLDWALSNAFDYSQSMKDVVDDFSSYKVSTWLWDTIRSNSVDEYGQGDLSDGYVVNSTQDPISFLRVSYPKFKTKYGTHISLKNGVWNNATSSYDSKRLKVINVPVLKSHSSYAVTACVKHYMGIVSQPLTGAHSKIQYGAMGTEMVETRFPTLNILDAIWINANPKESGSSVGPSTPYQAASFTNVIGSSRDPVALEYWASKHILIPAAIEKGYTTYSSLDPDYAPVTPGLTESYHNYLERSTDILRNAGFQATMNETEISVYVSQPTAAVHNLDTHLSYTTIQAAINATETLDGHTIFVEERTYHEKMVVDKALSLVGEDRSKTIIEGNRTSPAITVMSSNVTIKGFTIKNAASALALYSDGNTLLDNIFQNHSMYAIYLESTSSNTIVGNILSNNNIGIYINSGQNVVYHNNFINNTNHVMPFTNSTSWDNGCEGNYWDNYNGTDSNGDGIGDTYLPWEDVDHYPLISPYWNPGDINHDLIVDIYDVVLACGAYGSTPPTPRWNPHCDIAEPYGIVDIHDIVLLAGNYGEQRMPQPRLRKH